MKDRHISLEWAKKAADEVLERFPNNEVYTCAAGISPSGKVHFGNFRDVITSYAVYLELKSRGLNARLLFSWDNFDRFRKVPAGIDSTFSKYIGFPLSKIPSPSKIAESYAQEFQNEYEQSMKEMGIDLEYKNQTKEYESGRYDDKIIFALQKRKEIADILLSFMTTIGKEKSGIIDEEYRNSYYPISVYSEFSGTDNTEIINYDGDSSITYICLDTKKESTFNLREKHIVKLAWKIDWPMRWQMENVCFEPGGHDHASPGGSYDTSSVIADKIFGIKKPVFREYKFVGIQGMNGKMSGSKGNAVTPAELLHIYTPDLLLWLYERKDPDQTFSLAFDSEIYRQYSEYDAEFYPDETKPQPIPFRQIVGFGQIVQWDIDKLHEVLKALDLKYIPESISERLPKAKSWLEIYNREELITLRDTVNTEYINTMSNEQKKLITDLRDFLTHNKTATIPEIETRVYAIPRKDELDIKANAPFQKAFFKDVYNLLISNDKGPRLSTFLWAIDREKAIKLLTII